MLKLAGACLILCSAAGIGASYSGDLKRRVRELRVIKQMMYMLQGEIRYAHLPLPEAFTHVSVRLPAPFGLFLSGIADELKKADGRTLSEIWKAEEQKYIKKLHLTRTDLEQLETLGEVLGYLDTEMQLAAIRLYLEQLEQSLAEAQEQMGSRQPAVPEPWDRGRCLSGHPVTLTENGGTMSVNLIFKIAAVGILVSVICQVLKHSGREEQAFLTSLAGLVLVLFWILPYIFELFDTMKQLFAL